MLDSSYFQSLSQELDALKGRVRNLINNKHWLTDGEWKESVLRAVLKRHLPKSVEVGRGFVITPNGTSSQIDILIYDSTKPILFQDGDLVFVTRDAVIGVIEVKSSLTLTTLRKSLKKLCKNAEFIEQKPRQNRVYGLFTFDSEINNISEALQILKTVVKGSPNRVIQLMHLGNSKLIHYWQINPLNDKEMYYKWHAYDLPQKAAGYFIHNIVEYISPQSVYENQALWFPIEGKEGSRVAEIDF
jgi:hypothetical protein